jgi:transketolase
MAIAEAYLAARFNRPGYPVVDHYTYVLSGDGCMMEGVAAEAASLAGTLALGKLILLLRFQTSPLREIPILLSGRMWESALKAYGWQVISVEDGNDINGILKGT